MKVGIIGSNLIIITNKKEELQIPLEVIKELISKHKKKEKNKQ